MENERTKAETTEPAVGAMHKRRETMADGRRYIIYYTFGDSENAANGGENQSAANEASGEGRRKEENV